MKTKTPEQSQQPSGMRTDAFTGLAVQPSFVLVVSVELLGVNSRVKMIRVYFRSSCVTTALIYSSLHLMLVTCERLVAIRFTVRYPYMYTKENIKVAVTVFWLFAFPCGVFRNFIPGASPIDYIISFVLIL